MLSARALPRGVVARCGIFVGNWRCSVRVMTAVAVVMIPSFGTVSVTPVTVVTVGFTASLVSARTRSGRAREQTINGAAAKRWPEDHRNAEIHGQCQLKHKPNPNCPLLLGHYMGAVARGQRRLKPGRTPRSVTLRQSPAIAPPASPLSEDDYSECIG